jgi:nitroreductase
MFRNMLNKTIHKTQHVQRNFDLSKEIPEEDRLVIEEAATQCPSKQNVAFYDVLSITDRDVIESIHEATEGFVKYDEDSGESKTLTNSQTLANMLLVFLERKTEHDEHRVDLGTKTGYNDSALGGNFETDMHMAVGIAAGYVNMTAGVLGYGTGCCRCIDKNEVKKILATNQDPVLMMGIGYADESRNRREHHVSGEVFPTIKKEEIYLERID